MVGLGLKEKFVYKSMKTIILVPNKSVEEACGKFIKQSLTSSMIIHVFFDNMLKQTTCGESLYPLHGLISNFYLSDIGSQDS